MTATLTRLATGDQGTFGVLRLGSFDCWTAEPPWRDNERSVSCIPQGTYEVRPRYSPRYKRHLHVLNVPGRSMILIHCGNLAGDKTKGFKTHSSGCILVGRRMGRLEVSRGKPFQKAVLASRFAMTDLLRALDNQPFTLTIKGVC
jgi:hypothetical protein